LTLRSPFRRTLRSSGSSSRHKSTSALHAAAARHTNERKMVLLRQQMEDSLVPSSNRLRVGPSCLPPRLRGDEEEGAPLSARAILSQPLPGLGLLDRAIVRSVVLAGRRRIHSIIGLEHIASDRDPFILALNHGTRLEAILVPPLLFLLRRGRRIHFMADWTFRMIPGVDVLYRRAGVITIARKPARPRFLNVLKPLFTDTISPIEQARRHLVAGRSIAVFPEGTVNRGPPRLKRGCPGAARLSLETGVPVIPVGPGFFLHCHEAA
jgi:hypothetical protein